MSRHDKGFLLCEGLFYLAFLAVDLLFPGAWRLSSLLKYAGMLLAFGYLLTLRRVASRYDWQWTVVAFALTLTADVFLLFTSQLLPGMALFCCAHLAYLGRYRAPGRRVFRVLALAAWLLIAGLWLAGRRGWLFYPAALTYAVLLLAATVGAFRAALPRHSARLARLGMLLLIACDINVALYNLLAGGPAYRAASLLMWFFYLPSQICIVMSAKARDGQAPPEMPPPPAE